MSTSSAGPTKAPDAEYLMQVLADPGKYGPEVQAAVEVLLLARHSSSNAPAFRAPTSSFAKGRFDAVVGLLTDAIDDLSDDGVYVHADIPHYVPDGWADFLNAAAIEDPGLTLPWLEQFEL